jgi:hypothetical protein
MRGKTSLLGAGKELHWYLGTANQRQTIAPDGRLTPRLGILFGPLVYDASLGAKIEYWLILYSAWCGLGKRSMTIVQDTSLSRIPTALSPGYIQTFVLLL